MRRGGGALVPFQGVLDADLPPNAGPEVAQLVNVILYEEVLELEVSMRDVALMQERYRRANLSERAQQ